MMLRRKPIETLTYLAANSEIQGDLHVDGNLRVDGIVHGLVEVRGDMEISSTGLVEGPEVRARNLTVHGVVKAHVIVEGKLTLSRTARLEGDVLANGLDVEAGAYYTGYIETCDLQGFLPEVESQAALATSEMRYEGYAN
jgi:cytoskeletal protein CcmA (bactofilin family)